MGDQKKTVVDELAEVRTQLAQATSDLSTARTSLDELRAKVQKSEGELTARTDELVAERRAHSETRLKLQKAESDFAAEKTAHDALKAKSVEDLQREAAKIAAANGHPQPLPGAAATKPGEVQETPQEDRLKLSATELFERDLKKFHAENPR